MVSAGKTLLRFVLAGTPLLVLAVCLILLAVPVRCSNHDGGGGPPDDPPVRAGRRIPDPVPEDGFRKMGTPRPGDWLDRFPEERQTFEDYREECRNLVTEERSVFYIRPIGDLTGRERMTVDAMGKFAEIYFGVRTVVRMTRPHFENGYVRSRRQWNATTITGQLLEERTDDAIAYIGITNVDLFSSGLNFVFGEASLRNRCGIYSLHRYGTEDEALYLRRALKLMVHEAGHIFSITHCTEYECVMNGANSLREDDAHPMHLCPDDLPKLEWNVGFDRMERYRKLAEFYEKHGLDEEARWVRDRLR